MWLLVYSQRILRAEGTQAVWYITCLMSLPPPILHYQPITLLVLCRMHLNRYLKLCAEFLLDKYALAKLSSRAKTPSRLLRTSGGMIQPSLLMLTCGNSLK